MKFKKNERQWKLLCISLQKINENEKDSELWRFKNNLKWAKQRRGIPNFNRKTLNGGQY